MIIQKQRIVGEIVFPVLMVLLTFNTLIIPFDKILIPVVLFFLLLIDNWHINKNTLFGVLLVFVYIVFISFININTNDLLLFYPLLFTLTAIVASKSLYVTPTLIRRVLFVNILIGIVLLVLFYVGFPSEFVHNLSSKGLPMLASPIGLSPTSQVYGTCCILCLLIALECKDSNSLFIGIVLLAVIITLNRASLVFLILLLFYYRRKVFYIVMSVFSTCCILYYDVLKVIFLSSATMDSRIQLREGMELSYWKSDNIMVWIFGRANHQTSDVIAQQTYWGRSYIENGMDFILHSYGIFGMLIYFVLLFSLVYFLFRRKQYKFIVFTLYYFIVVQYLTNEFLSSSIFFFLLTILLLSSAKLSKQIA